MQQLIRNSAVIFEHLNAGILVSRNEEPVFANRFLLDLLGYESLEAFHLGGGIPRLLTRPAKAGSNTLELTTCEGHLVPMIARQKCVEWDDLPSTLLILHPTEGSEVYSSAEALFSLYETESRELNAILDTATDGVAVLDAAGRILTLNRSGEALFGYDQNEVVGEPFSILFDAQSRAIAEDYLEGLKTNAVKSLLNDGREITGRARQGGPIPIFMTLGCVSSSHADEKDLKFCALLRDMTHWKKVEQELDTARQGAERASALKSDFLAKVSHEIRTPLNAILGFAEVIMDERFGPIGNERYKDYLKDIHMSGAHVMSLVNDLLDLSKIEAGKLELNLNAVDANRIISECVAIMQPQANQERVIMRMSLASNLPAISADERSLRQIILNLLSNAVKFNEPGGQVIIATASSDTGHAIIRIRDTGIGMSEQDIETALEPFRQLATTRQTSGTGLGLPLTKALVEANHAFFAIKSKKQEGTLVEVTFPVMRVSA
jgi:PAS domain S-box-containing protein